MLVGPCQLGGLIAIIVQGEYLFWAVIGPWS